MSAILQATNINWRIGNARILQDISLQLNAGEIVGIIGPNGAGKSSLLNILAGITEPDSGALQLHGAYYNTLERRAFARQLAYLEQEARINWPLLTERVIELGRSPHQSAYSRLEETDNTAIAQAIAETGIAHLLGRNVATLSQGEKMLVALTRVFATQPQIILADEPVAALDPNHQLMIMELINSRSRNKSNAALIVLHDLSLAARYCDRLILLVGGRVASEGSPSAVLSDENLREFYKIECYSDFNEPAVVQPTRRIN
ncbi:MAG: ABC transporter [Gammaproteobacteria bacterium]|nr:ABC transporter [Gammaproteobacteria bacterium]